MKSVNVRNRVRQHEKLMLKCFRQLKKLFFCQHDWKEIIRSSVPPLEDILDLYQIENESRVKHLVGFTTVYFECSECRRNKSLELLGPTPQQDQLN